MKQYLLIITFLLPFLALSQPKIEIVGGNTYDWGNVRPIEDPLKTSMVIKNKGNKPLRIFRVEPGCGCTTAPLSKDYLQPGDSAHLDIKLELRSAKGPLEKPITIYTDDPVNKNLKVTLKANVLVALEANPKIFGFSIMKVGEETIAKMKLTNNTDTDITIKKIISSHEDIKLSIQAEDVIKAKSSLDVIATYVPKEEGVFNASMTIMTDNMDMPRLRLTAWGKAE